MNFDDYYLHIQNNIQTDTLHFDEMSENNFFLRDSKTEENLFFLNSGLGSGSSSTNQDSLLFQPLDSDLENNFINPPRTIISLDEDEDEEKEEEKPVEPKKTNETTTKDGKEIFYPFKKIETEIIPKLGLSDDIKAKITKNEKEIEIIEKNLKPKGKGKMKEKEKDTPKDENEETVQSDKIECGRKKLGDKSERPHNRDSFDNVVKKVKGDIFTEAASFLNQIIDLNISSDRKKALTKMTRKSQREPDNKDLIKDLNYEIINKLKRDFNLALLDMNFKDFFSQDISSRYTAQVKDSNKIILETISEEEENNEIINYVFDLKIIDWLNYFTHKIELEFLDEIEKEKDIKFRRAEALLNDIGTMEDSYYFSNCLFHLYNFRWWFEVKTGRASKESQKPKKPKKSKKTES